MPKLTYLNAILTVLAVLLAMNLWVGLHGPGGALLAPGQHVHAQGIPDGGAQRLEMVNQLKLLNTRVNEVSELLRSGELRVQIDAARRDDEQPAPLLGPRPSRPQPQLQPRPAQPEDPSRPTGANPSR